MKKLLVVILGIVIVVGFVITHQPIVSKEKCHEQCTENVNTLNTGLGKAMHSCLLQCAELE